MPSLEADDPSYNDMHRAFLQAFMARGTLTYTESKPLLAAIQSAESDQPVSADDINEPVFLEYISACSSAVSSFDYEIRSTIPQNIGDPDDVLASQRQQQRRGPSNGRITTAELSNSSLGTERVYALINSSSDALTQLATTFTPDELAFVKRVLDEMFERNNSLRQELCAVTGRAALQLHSTKEISAAGRRRTLDSQAAAAAAGGEATQGTAGNVQAISMSQAQTVLAALVAQGWLEVSRRGYYSLTPRALMELRTWLVETYNDEDEEDEEEGRSPAQKIKLCMACREIVTIGQRCPKLSCKVRLHDRCADRYFKMQKAERCGVCKLSWEGHGWVGERAVPSSGARRSTNDAATAGRQRHRSGNDGADDEDDDDEDE